MSWITEVPIAHRGLFDAARGLPENSLPAFAAAIEAGYPIELDVRALSDGAVAVFHDATLSRMTGASGAIGARTAADLADLRLSGTAARVPLLAEALELVAARVPLMIELKSEGAPGALEAGVLAAVSGYRGPLAVVSFNHASLAWFRARAPGIPRGQNAARFRGARLSPGRRFALRNLLVAWASRPHFISYELAGLPCLAATLARRAGVPLVTFTVKTESDRARAMALADNFMFEGIRPRAAGPARGATG